MIPFVGVKGPTSGPAGQELGSAGSEVKGKVREALKHYPLLCVQRLVGPEASVSQRNLRWALVPSSTPSFIIQVPKSLSPLGSDLGKSLAQATLVLEGRDCR